MLLLDASGLTATPGLIDAHSHVGGFAMEGADLNEITDPVTAHLCAIDAIDIHCDAFKALHTFGITAACFVPGSANVVCGTGFVAKTSSGTPCARRGLTWRKRRPPGMAGGRCPPMTPSARPSSQSCGGRFP